MTTLYQTIGGVGPFIANILKKLRHEETECIENPCKSNVIEDESVQMDIDEVENDRKNLKRGRSVFGDGDDHVKSKFPNISTILKRGRSIFQNSDIEEHVEPKCRRRDVSYEMKMSKKRVRDETDFVENPLKAIVVECIVEDNENCDDARASLKRDRSIFGNFFENMTESKYRRKDLFYSMSISKKRDIEHDCDGLVHAKYMKH